MRRDEMGRADLERDAEGEPETVAFAAVGDGPRPAGPERSQSDRRREDRRRTGRRRAIVLLAAVILLGVVAGGGIAVYRSFFSATPDYPGPGEGDVVVQVQSGDTTRAIGQELLAKGVVASTAAFTEAAAGDGRIRSVQPGYYRLRQQMSGVGAVALMLDPAARLGVLDIRGGVQLDDTRSPDGVVTPGVLSLISKATCGADGTCVPVEDLRKAMMTTDPAALGVPDWALAAVRKAPPERRLEGLLRPARYDVPPGASAADVLKALLATSVASFEKAGIEAGAQKIGMKPYDVLVISSLIEKESIIEDMPKVSRVLYNRLGSGQRLQLDTTINYPLDVPTLLTSPENRAKPGPYNTYLNAGLPVTPIAAAGADALAAALAPADGPWMFFVPCEKAGTSCFAVTFAEHQANIAKARANGVF
jgi:UPF0755 protein